MLGSAIGPVFFRTFYAISSRFLSHFGWPVLAQPRRRPPHVRRVVGRSSLLAGRDAEQDEVVQLPMRGLGDEPDAASQVGCTQWLVSCDERGHQG